MQFKWNDKFQPVTLYDSKLLDEFEFNQLTKVFLKEAGLPKYAAPFLSFVENNNVKYNMMRLTDYFDFLAPEFAKYVVIGSSGNGDEIAIDTMDNCRIKLLDHEDYFAEKLINSSIQKLCFSLIIYKDFIDCILDANGEDAFIDSNFSDAQLNNLMQRLTDNDPDAMCENCFWSQEIEILNANRDDMNK